jgi:hypothetical protein
MVVSEVVPREIAARRTNNKNIEAKVRFPVVEEGSWMAKPKGPHQIAWERGYTKADLIKVHDAS